MRAAERAIGEQPAVFPGERNALGHALINDIDADLRQPIDVGLAGAEIAAFDRVVEQALNAVAVVLIILGRVDSALGRDAVGAARAVLVTEGLHVVAQLRQARRRRCAGQSGPDDDDVEFSLVGGIDQLHVEPVLIPLLLQWPGWNFGIEFHLIHFSQIEIGMLM